MDVPRQRHGAPGGAARARAPRSGRTRL